MTTTIAWRITSATTGTTDEHGFALMNVAHASGQNQKVELKLLEWGAGSYQDGKNLVSINLYVDRKGNHYVTGNL